jgi:hypothetical protein
MTFATAAAAAPWPTWKKVMAYVVMSAISLLAIYFVDVKVHRDAVMPPAATTAPAALR